MMEIEECVRSLVEAVKEQQRTRQVHITKCQGMITAEDIYAGMMVPPFPKSAMDGYAVKSDEIKLADKEHPVFLKVIGELLAGDYKEFVVEENSAVRVMTGAMIPEGYDAVVRQEDTDYGEDEVAIYASVKPYMNYCKVGEDILTGTLVVAKNTRITPLHVSVLASLGIEYITVYEPAKIAIISTGTEVVQVGNALQPGKIYNSIAYHLNAEIAMQGLEVVRLTTCVDDEELLVKHINEALLEADFIITTGAVSVGKKDIIPRVVDLLGAKVLFRGANIQPGTPTMASTKDGKVLLHLSGNPYAAVANFEIYFWSAMAKMMHNESYLPRVSKCILQSEYAKVNKMRRRIRAFAKDGKVSIVTQVHASSVMSNLLECNCYIDLEAGRSVGVGDEVTVVYFKNCFLA